MQVKGRHYRTVWMEGSTVHMINQPLIPHKFEIVDLRDHHETARAIRDMTVRGAPAIGGAGAMGLAQAVLNASPENWLEEVEAAERELAATRPTAQDLFHALEYVRQAIEDAPNHAAACERAVEAARRLADASVRDCEEIGRLGAERIKDGDCVLTHCNAGWLATVDWGTALAPVYKAAREGKKVFVFTDETRPRCQGARLTAWELRNENIPHAIIADNAAGYFMARGEVDLVITGVDRVARNGDAANKIGTYEKAVLARRHNIPFYIAAPLTTIDFDCGTGLDIPIEERDENEVLYMFGRGDDGLMTRLRVAPDECAARNPAFDVTPAELITGFITPRGVFAPDEIAARESELRFA